MNIYEARKRYIDKIGKKLIDYKSKGYLILDEYNKPIEDIKQEGFSNGDTLNFGLNIDGGIYYDHDPDFDNGYYTTIKEFKEIFKKFKVINPKDFKRLVWMLQKNLKWELL